MSVRNYALIKYVDFCSFIYLLDYNFLLFLTDIPKAERLLLLFIYFFEGGIIAIVFL